MKPGLGQGCQDLAPQFPDTRNLTPETNELRYCCPAGAAFSELGFGKSLVTYFQNESTFFGIIYVYLCPIEGFRNWGIEGLKDKINKLKEIGFLNS